MIGFWAYISQLPKLLLLNEVSDMDTPLPPVPTDPREMKDPSEIEELITPQFLQLWTDKLYEQAETSIETEGHPTRVLGSVGHKSSMDMILDAVKRHSNFYTYEIQPFIATSYKLHDHIFTVNGKDVEAKPFQMAPSGKAHGTPVYATDFGCLPSDYANVEGKIVIVQRGNCVFGDKAELAGLAGASAVLIFDPEAADKDEIFSGDLGTPLEHQVPVLGISANTAASLNENSEISLSIESEIKNVETANIIVETIDGDHDNVVFAGAHSDSVGDGPGMNDNGSGLIAMLAVVHQLSNFKVKNAVRIAWWSAEEEGLLGSLHYTENLTKREAAKIRMFIDLDMLASTNFAYEIYDSDDKENPKGSSMLRDTFIDWYTDRGYNYTLQPFDGRSDYVGFIDIGIPAGGFDSGVEELKTHENYLKFGGEEGVAYDPCYHLKCDDKSNLNFEPWLVNTRLVAYTVAKYSQSLKGFPERDLSYYEQGSSKPSRFNKTIKV